MDWMELTDVRIITVASFALAGLVGLLLVQRFHAEVKPSESVNIGGYKELDACPFCGSKRVVMTHDTETGLYRAKCSICHVQGPLGMESTNAIERWNNRILRIEG